MALPASCPLCNAGAAAQSVVTPHVYGDPAISDRERRAFFKCGSCDVNYLFPRLSSAQEHDFYAAEFASFMSARAGDSGGWALPERHIEANRPTVNRRMRYLRPLLRPSARVLEIGCSSGFMLYPLMDAGHACTGVEPSGVFGEYVRSRGLECFASVDALRASDPNDTYDVVMHFFVLEHVAQPREFLAAQLALLKPGGVLVFEVPNAADALVTVYDIPAFERFYWSIAHHWYFTEPSLAHLLKTVGAPHEIRRDQRYDLSNHMVWARDGKPGGMGRYTQKLGAGIEDAYKQALVAAGHCDTLIGIIRKP